MRMKWVLTTAVVALSVTAAAGAQSKTSMHQPSKGNAMSMTYTGCVESFNHGAAFLLTKIDSGGAESVNGDKAMKHHDMAMTHDDASMNSGAATMQQERKPMADDKDEKMDAMPSKSFALAGSIALGKHVGQRVSVTGSLSDGSTMRQEVSTLTITTLKVIAKSCS